MHKTTPPPEFSANVNHAWQLQIGTSLNLLKIFVDKGMVSVQDACDASALIHDIIDISECFEHEGSVHNFSIQAQKLIDSL